MARKPGRPRKNVEPTQAPSTAVMPPDNELKKLLRACSARDEGVAGFDDPLRERITSAKKKHNLHAKAFSVIRALDKMEAEDLALFFEHFDHYCIATGLRARADSVPGLAFEPETQADPVNDANVSRPEFGPRSGALADVG